MCACLEEQATAQTVGRQRVLAVGRSAAVPEMRRFSPGSPRGQRVRSSGAEDQRQSSQRISALAALAQRKPWPWAVASDSGWPWPSPCLSLDLQNQRPQHPHQTTRSSRACFMSWGCAASTVSSGARTVAGRRRAGGRTSRHQHLLQRGIRRRAAPCQLCVEALAAGRTSHHSLTHPSSPSPDRRQNDNRIRRKCCIL